MSNIIGGGSNAKQNNVAGSLRFQTSQAGSVIPLVYGTTKIAPNLLDYDDFTAYAPGAGQGSKGKGGVLGGKGGDQETYSASIILGLCQGPVVGFGQVWWNKSQSALTALPGLSTTNVGSDGQSADPFWTANHAAKAIGYSGTANFTIDNYQLGGSPTLPNFNVEIVGIESGSGMDGFDANPAAIITDFLTNSRYGANFPSANLDSLTAWSDYCKAAGIFLSPALTTQQAAQQSLGDIVKITNSAIVWSGGLLKILPFGDQPLSITYWNIQIGGLVTQLDTISLTFTGGGLSGSPIMISYQAQPPQVNADTVNNGSLGRGLAAVINNTASLTSQGIFAGVTPLGVLIAETNTAVLPTVTASATGSETFNVFGPLGPQGFTPNTTPIYSLGEDDYIVQSSSVGTNLGVSPGGPALRMGATPVTGGFADDPVHIVRSSPADENNWIEVECLDRGNSYNPNPVIAFDQGSIDLYGIRKDASLKAQAIVDPYLTGPIVAQLLLQRNLLYRNTYSFQLGWKYCLLEPMDLVQITDARLGAGAITVQITAVAEDEEGTLAITAQDWLGTPGAVLYPPAIPVPTLPNGTSSVGQGGGSAAPRNNQSGSSSSSTPVYNAGVPSVNAPFIIEAPSQLLTAQGIASPTLIIGLSGGPASAGWGGAQVYASLDGSTYGFQGTDYGPAVMGVTTADLPAFSGANPDTAHTLSVNLAESGGTLASVSAATAAAFVSLCAVQNSGGALELLAFETATLVSGNAYNVTTLYRGLYGTSAVDHPAGAQFIYLGSGQYYHQTLPTAYINQNIWFKFLSFNGTGGGLESLASATAYEYLVNGSSSNPLDNPVIAALAAGTSQNWGSVAQAETAAANFGPISLPVALDINLGASLP